MKIGKERTKKGGLGDEGEDGKHAFFMKGKEQSSV